MFKVLRRLAIACIVLAALVTLVISVRNALPPKTIVIESGPVGGSYHENALVYARKLEAAGLKTEVRPNPQSLEIVEHVNADSPRIDIGFTVQALDRARYPNVASAGVIELQPLFIFYNVNLGQLQTPAGLKGKSLVMPPQNSASAEAARKVLGLYGINQTNTRFTYLPIAEAAEALKAGKHDVGLFMLAPANAMVSDLARTRNLSLLSVPEAVGVSRVLANLKSVVLPMGAFDLQSTLPSGDISLVAGTVNVIVRKNINPAVLYILLETMKDQHEGQTLVSAKGEYPSAVGTELAIHPLAAQWAKAGTPWVFQRFTPVLASLIDKYWLLVLIVLIVCEVYRTGLYLHELMQLGASSTALRILQRLQKRADAGHPPGHISKRLFNIAETMTAHKSQNEKAKALLNKLRPAMEADSPL